MNTTESRHPQLLAMLVMVCCTMIVVVSSSTVLNVALPTIVGYYQASSMEATWLILGYMVANTSSLAIFGKLADRLDRRRMFLAGIAIFSISALIAGFSPWMPLLIAMRVVQALGVSMMVSNAATILASVFPRHRLSQAMAYYIASISVAQVIGPTIGGLLLAVLPWQWLFWANVPIGAALGLWARSLLHHLPQRDQPTRLTFDTAGSVLLVISIGAVLFALSSTQTFGIASPIVLTGFGIGLGALVLLILVERRAPDPLIDPQAFRSGYFSALNVAGFTGIMPRTALLITLPIYFQGALQRTPAAAGLLILALPASIAVGSLLSSSVARFLGVDGGSIAGAVITLIGTLPLPFILGQPSALLWLVAGQIVVGIGGGIFAGSNSTAIMQVARPDQLSTFNGVRSMIQSVGNSVSVAVAFPLIMVGLSSTAAAFFLAGSPGGLDPMLIQSVNDGYRALFIVLATAAALSLVVTVYVFLKRPTGPRGQIQ